MSTIPFYVIWTGQQISYLGSSLAQFALVWWVTQVTGSATVLATATAVAILPNVLLGPFVGAMVDRCNRRVVMIAADGVVALTAAWVVYLFWTNAIQIGHVYIIMVVRSVGDRIHYSAMSASTPLMVPQKHLPRVSGLSQMVAGATDILSPSLGALLLGLMRLHTIMAIDVVTAAFAIAPLLFVRIPQPERSTTIASASGGKPSLWADAWAGVRYIWGWPGLSILWMVALLLNLLCGPAFYLTPILVTKFFRGGAMQLGWANSIWGVGAVLGGLVLSIWGGSRRRVVTLFLAVIGVGLGFLLVAFAPATVFPLALAGLFAVGAISAISGGLFPVLFQEIVAPEMQGRVFAMWGSLVSLMLMIGMAIAGPVADRLGVRVPYLVGGLSQVLIGAGAFAVPALMHLEDKGRP